jgi:hypothetical protein
MFSGPCAVQGSEFMTARHAGSDILTESIRGIDVERGAAGELNRVFDFKLMSSDANCPAQRIRCGSCRFRQWPIADRTGKGLGVPVSAGS